MASAEGPFLHFSACDALAGPTHLTLLKVMATGMEGLWAPLPRHSWLAGYILYFEHFSKEAEKLHLHILLGTLPPWEFSWQPLWVLSGLGVH